MSTPLDAMIEAAREIRRVHEAQAAYTRELQALAAEARRTGKSQSHRIGPRVHDYGNGIERLLIALAAYERRTPEPHDAGKPGGGR